MISLKEYHTYFFVKKFIFLFRELYKDKPISLLRRELKILVKNKKYKLIIAFYDGKPVAMTSISSGFLIYCGKYMQLSNLYVQPQYRNLGIAKKLIERTEYYARKYGCKHLMLDSYIENQFSHKTYLRENFVIRAHHFMKKLHD